MVVSTGGDVVMEKEEEEACDDGCPESLEGDGGGIDLSWDGDDDDEDGLILTTSSFSNGAVVVTSPPPPSPPPPISLLFLLPSVETRSVNNDVDDDSSSSKEVAIVDVIAFVVAQLEYMRTDQCRVVLRYTTPTWSSVMTVCGAQ